MQEPIGRDTGNRSKHKERCFLSGEQQRQVCETVIGCNRIEQQEPEQGAKPRGSGRGTEAVGGALRGLTGSRVREQCEQTEAFLIRKEAGAGSGKVFAVGLLAGAQIFQLEAETCLCRLVRLAQIAGEKGSRIVRKETVIFVAA